MKRAAIMVGEATHTRLQQAATATGLSQGAIVEALVAAHLAAFMASERAKQSHQATTPRRPVLFGLLRLIGKGKG